MGGERTGRQNGLKGPTEACELRNGGGAGIHVQVRVDLAGIEQADGCGTRQGLDRQTRQRISGETAKELACRTIAMRPTSVLLNRTACSGTCDNPEQNGRGHSS